MILAPVVRGRKGEFRKLFEQLATEGFVRVRVDKQLRQLDEEIKLDRRKNHTIEVVVDRLLLKAGIEGRLASSIETAMKLAKGIVEVAIVNGEERLYSQEWACVDCGMSLPPSSRARFFQQCLRRLLGVPRFGQPIHIRSCQSYCGLVASVAGRRTGSRRRFGRVAA